MYVSESSPVDATVAVLPFRDSRPMTNQSMGFLLYALPGSPMGFVTYERPGAAAMFNTIAEFDFDVEEDLGRAAVRSLEESGVVRRVYYTDGGDTREADYVLRGVALSSRYDGKVFSYFLSVFGPMLWIVGFPAGSSATTVDIELSLQDKGGRELWSYAGSAKRSVIQGLYYNFGNDALGFAQAMQDIMNGAAQDLEKSLPLIHRAAEAVAGR